MRAMILATFGWGCWWIYALLGRVAPSLAPSREIVIVLSCSFGLIGLALAALTLRARRTWLLFVLVPLFANLALLLFPLLVDGR